MSKDQDTGKANIIELTGQMLVKVMFKHVTSKRDAAALSDAREAAARAVVQAEVRANGHGDVRLHFADPAWIDVCATESRGRASSFVSLIIEAICEHHKNEEEMPASAELRLAARLAGLSLARIKELVCSNTHGLYGKNPSQGKQVDATLTHLIAKINDCVRGII